MATSGKIHLVGQEKPIYQVPPLKKDTAEKVSGLLQENLDTHHCFFNDKGFHNHISHHLLTLYALGAPAEKVEIMYAANKSYQRPTVLKINADDSLDMHKPEHFARHLGDEDYYHDYLLFFRDEIQARGWEDVVQEYLFRKDARANDMLARLLAGVMHPYIYLGFGVEFGQPAIIAEALAHCAVHDGAILDYLLRAETVASRARSTPESIAETKNITLLEVLERVRHMEKLASGSTWDGRLIPDGLLAYAGNELSEIAGRYIVTEDEIELKSAEIMNVATYFSAASQKPLHIPKLDFFSIHCVTASIFQTAFQRCASISRSQQARLLEWKARIDIAIYASRHAPELRMSEISTYIPKVPSQTWHGLLIRALALPDDGHVVKLLRALASASQICVSLEKASAINNHGDGEIEERFPIRGEEMWLNVAHLAMDSFEAGGPRWVGNTPDGWDSVPLRQ